MVTDGFRIVTNGVPRDVLYAHEVTARERRDLDYLDWPALDAGNDSASFFRYRGVLYDLGEFEAVRAPSGLRSEPVPLDLAGWSAYQTDSAFSAVLIRWADEQFDTIVVGRASW